MRTFERVVWRKGLIVLSVLAMALGIVAFMSQGRAEAVQPTPDCGPTREWVCVFPGCPDCPVVLFEGTVCEKRAFEKRTGRVCSPP